MRRRPRAERNALENSGGGRVAGRGSRGAGPAVRAAGRRRGRHGRRRHDGSLPRGPLEVRAAAASSGPPGPAGGRAGRGAVGAPPTLHSHRDSSMRWRAVGKSVRNFARALLVRRLHLHPSRPLPPVEESRTRRALEHNRAPCHTPHPRLRPLACARARPGWARRTRSAPRTNTPALPLPHPSLAAAPPSSRPCRMGKQRPARLSGLAAPLGPERQPLRVFGLPEEGGGIV